MSKKSRQRKAEAKRKELERRLQESQTAEEKEEIKYNIIELLRTERQDSKPNLAKFLKEYVHDIRTSFDTKVQFWPSLKYKITRVYVRFFDGHMLIWNKVKDFGPDCYLYDGLDEKELTEKQSEVIMQFFTYLWEFKFVYEQA